MVKNKIKNILFDLGGVLLNIDYNLTKDAFKAVGVDDFETMFSQFTANKLFAQLEKGEVSPQEFYQTLQARYPHLSEDSINEAWNAMLLDFRGGSIALLKKLKPRYKLYLLSNTNEIHIADFLSIFAAQFPNEDFLGLFDKIYYSNEIFQRKPDVAAFQFVLEDAEIAANETMFIDDSYPNINTANEMGFLTHLLTQDETINELFDKNLNIKTDYLTSS